MIETYVRALEHTVRLGGLRLGDGRPTRRLNCALSGIR